MKGYSTIFISPIWYLTTKWFNVILCFYPIYPTPGRIWHKVNYSKNLNSEFSFSYTSCLTKTEEPSLPHYLPIAGGRIIGFIPFPRVLVLCEMQSVSSRVWTRVAVSFSYDDNHYTTGTSYFVFMMQVFFMRFASVLCALNIFSFVQPLNHTVSLLVDNK